MTKLALERLKPENIIYTQLFINYLSAKDPRKLKFFNEAGIKLPDVGGRSYGHSVVGPVVLKLLENQNHQVQLSIY